MVSGALEGAIVNAAISFRKLLRSLRSSSAPDHSHRFRHFAFGNISVRIVEESVNALRVRRETPEVDARPIGRTLSLRKPDYEATLDELARYCNGSVSSFKSLVIYPIDRQSSKMF